MSTGRAPWWLSVAAAPFVAYALVVCWVLALGPRPSGLAGMDCGEQVCLVTRVLPGSPAALAGIAPGDTLGTWDGQLTGWRLWGRINRSWAATHTLTIERAGQKAEVTLDLGRRLWRHWTTVSGLQELVGALSGLSTMGLALLVAFTRPRDPAARLGALFCATLGSATFTFGPWVPSGFGYAMGQLPLGVALWPIVGWTLATGTMHESSLSWALRFPRPVVSRWWVYALVWLPALVRLPWGLSTRLANDLPGLGVARLAYPQGVFAALYSARVVYTLAVPAVLLWSYRRTTDVNERRRLRVVLVGLAVSFSAASVHLWLQFWGQYALPGILDSAWALLLRTLVLAMPLSLTYAILRHRLFDVRLIIRRGLQYAAARGLLVSLAPICAALLAVDLALHGDEPLAQIVMARGWLYGVLGVVGLVLHSRRTSWLNGLDRRFFRERYDARRLLSGVVDEIRAAASFERAAAGVTERVAAALHPEHVTLLVRAAGQPEFRPLAATSSGTHAAFEPASASGPAAGAVSLPAAATLVALLRVTRKPVEIPLTGSGWLSRQLPPEELERLRGLRIEWVFPLGLAAGASEGDAALEALLAVGPKLSEEPYSDEDQELLATIAASLALLLDRPATPTPLGAARSREAATATAEDATAALSAGAATPSAGQGGGRLIAGRYRLAAPLGHGGMGTVFEAVDLTLDREVALKVLRPELALDPDATARFKREARAAAAFTHPHVVTVHDFGVDDEGLAYLVMERLRGQTLREALRRDGRWSPARTGAVLGPVALAVDAAHERRLVHRDLKPENIFLARAGEVEVPKILDFGIAKVLRPLDGTASLKGTDPGLVVGTPTYMSPEQLRGGLPSPAWDLWSLAVIAYEALTASLPFPSPLTAPGYEAASAGRAASTRPTFGAAADSWDALFARLFAPDSTLRPADAKGLVAGITELAHLTPPPSSATPGPRAGL